MAKVTIPDQSVPLVDPRTGRINEHWYKQLVAIVQLLNQLEELLP
jgi:hypothetical protein